MRRIVVAALSTVSGLALLFSYHTSTNRAAASDVAVSPSATTEDGGSGTDAGSSGTLSSGTFTGDSVATRWGNVQVQITVKAGKITKSEAIAYPNENPRDVELNNYALPILSQEAVQEQNAQIDFVSGATITSDGYAQSLQSAIDQAFQ